MRSPRHPKRAGAAVVAAIIALTACGSSTTTAVGSNATTTSAGASGGTQVLPVTVDPIKNDSTVDALKIDSVLVENNVDSAGQATDDHLEIALSNTGSSALTGFEVFYTITDPTAKLSESYYTKLPPSFDLAGGATRTVHFDQTGAVDHFPDNSYSLYHTSKNALEFEVKVSAPGAAVQTMSVKKDAGGAENPSE
jgi:hypothetical protein